MDPLFHGGKKSFLSHTKPHPEVVLIHCISLSKQQWDLGQLTCKIQESDT